MEAKSIMGNSTAAISAALKESMDSGFKPTLALMFLSFSQDRRSICTLLDGQGITIVGHRREFSNA